MSDENVEREALYTLRDRWERIVASAKDGTAHVAIEVAGTYDPFACAISTLLARASRPREACSIESHPAPGGVPSQVGGATERGAGIVPQPGSPLAPEARPVAEKPLAWTAFSESASWTGVWCKTREGAQERVDEFKRRWPKTGPYRVVPLYAHPASAAGREGAVEDALTVLGRVEDFLRSAYATPGAKYVRDIAGVPSLLIMLKNARKEG